MAIDTFKNLAYGVVLLPPTPPHLGTTLTLANGHGARFPAAPFSISVWPFGVPADVVNCEICRVTGKAGDVLTIARIQEGSQPRTILAGDQVAQAMTVKWQTDVIALIEQRFTESKAYTDGQQANMKTYVDSENDRWYTYTIGIVDSKDALLRYPRVYRAAAVAVAALNIEQFDMLDIYAQTVAIKIDNTLGTIQEGHPMIVRLRDDGLGPRAITWGTTYMTACGTPLPTTTIQWQTMLMGFRFNSLYGKWQMVAIARE